MQKLWVRDKQEVQKLWVSALVLKQWTLRLYSKTRFIVKESRSFMRKPPVGLTVSKEDEAVRSCLYTPHISIFSVL